jgi:hypothetical protein
LYNELILRVARYKAGRKAPYFVRIPFGPIALTALALLSLSTTAHAGTISYTLTGTGASGTFNGSDFSGQSFTITGVADTANTATISGLPAMLLTSTTIQIGADPPATVTVSPYYMINAGLVFSNVLGFADASTIGGTKAFIVASGGTSWDMMSNFGPVSSTFFSNFPTSTDQGPIDLTGWTSATFTATATPEPGTLSLIVLGAIGMVAARRRRG